MNGKRRRLLLAAVDPMLEPGEQVEVATIVNLRSVSVRRTAAFAVASALVSGGGMAVVPVPTPMYLAMTGRRIFIFRANPTFARPEEHLMTIPRLRPRAYRGQGTSAQLVLRRFLPGRRTGPEDRVPAARAKGTERDSGGSAPGRVTVTDGFIPGQAPNTATGILALMR